jgi:hypothetical protein
VIDACHGMNHARNTCKMDTTTKHELPPIQPVTFAWASTLMLGLLAGVMVGWVIRGAMIPPAPPARQRLARNEHVRPQIFVQKKPVIKIADAPKPAAAPTEDSKPLDAKPRSSVHPSLAPAMPAMQGQIQPLPLATQVAPAFTEPPVESFHTLEAKARVIADAAGARVLSAKHSKSADGFESVTLTLSVPQEKADEVAARIRLGLGQHASVGDAKPTAPADTDELTGEEATLDALKKRYHDAELAFYPDAPALKSLEAQVEDEEKRVASLRKSEGLPFRLSVVLTQ